MTDSPIIARGKPKETPIKGKSVTSCHLSQLYAPGVPFMPTDRVARLPISDEDAAALAAGRIVVTWYGDRGVMSRAELRTMYEECD